MGALDRINQLKSEGRQDQEIIQALKTEGYAPAAIQDAFNQSKIKDAVGKENMANEQNQGNEGMQPSIMTSTPEDYQNQGYQQQQNEVRQTDYPSQQGEEQSQNQAQGYSSQAYSPQTPPQNQYGQEQRYSPQQPPQQTYPQESYPQDQYYQDSYYDQGGYAASDTDTIIEVAQQVFSEKVKDINSKIKELKEFKTIYKDKIDDTNERLKRMEKMFDKMQISILDKVGSFGKDLTHLRKEVDMVEDSFSKMHHKKK